MSSNSLTYLMLSTRSDTLKCVSGKVDRADLFLDHIRLTSVPVVVDEHAADAMHVAVEHPWPAEDQPLGPGPYVHTSRGQESLQLR